MRFTINRFIVRYTRFQWHNRKSAYLLQQYIYNTFVHKYTHNGSIDTPTATYWIMHGRRFCTLCGRVGLWILSFFGVENTWLATNSISLTPSIESERHSFDRQKRRCVPNTRARLLLADDWLILDFFFLA